MEDNSEYLHAHSDLIPEVNENMPDEEKIYMKSPSFIKYSATAQE